jgi:hypothetical protein
MGFLFCQAGDVLAQTGWSGGILNRVAQAIAAHSKEPQNQSSTQSKTGSKGPVTIQSISVGQIPKYIDTIGGLDGSVITEMNGNVGIGTASPSGLLHLLSTSTNGTSFFFQNSDTGGKSWRMLSTGTNNTGGAGIFGLVNATDDPNNFKLVVTPAGNVGIGTASPQAKLHVVGTVATGALTVTGDITASGNIAAKYQDVAEWVPASHAIPAGTVVTLDPERSNHVLASSHPYDTRVAGVVSAKPGVLLGERGEGKVMVATTGRVRVKVDATNAPIRVGDLLVTSDKEGIAMRSKPLDLGGTPIHRPGTLIGKALEPLEKGTGEILVLLSLQ